MMMFRCYISSVKTVLNSCLKKTLCDGSHNSLTTVSLGEGARGRGYPARLAFVYAQAVSRKTIRIR